MTDTWPAVDRRKGAQDRRAPPKQSAGRALATNFGTMAVPSALLVFVLQNLQTVQSLIDTQAQNVQQLQTAMAQCKTQADDWQQVAKARLTALDEQFKSDIGFHASLTGTLSEIDKRLHANEMLLNEYMARKK